MLTERASSGGLRSRRRLVATGRAGGVCGSCRSGRLPTLTIPHKSRRVFESVSESVFEFVFESGERGRFACAHEVAQGRRSFPESVFSMRQPSEPREHRANAVEQRERATHFLLRSEAQQLHGLERRRSFGRFSTRTAKARDPITARPTRGFCDTKKYSEESTAKLVGQRRIPPRQAPDYLVAKAKRLPRYPKRVEPMMVEWHTPVIGRKTAWFRATHTLTLATLEHELEHGLGLGHATNTHCDL